MANLFAMADTMNGYHLRCFVKGVDGAVTAGAEFVQAAQMSGQWEGSQFLKMLDQPLDFV
jgi:hypothetical protein